MCVYIYTYIHEVSRTKSSTHTWYLKHLHSSTQTRVYVDACRRRSLQWHVYLDRNRITTPKQNDFPTRYTKTWGVTTWHDTMNVKHDACMDISHIVTTTTIPKIEVWIFKNFIIPVFVYNLDHLGSFICFALNNNSFTWLWNKSARSTTRTTLLKNHVAPVSILRKTEVQGCALPFIHTWVQLGKERMGEPGDFIKMIWFVILTRKDNPTEHSRSGEVMIFLWL